MGLGTHFAHEFEGWIFLAEGGRDFVLDGLVGFCD